MYPPLSNNNTGAILWYSQASERLRRCAAVRGEAAAAYSRLRGARRSHQHKQKAKRSGAHLDMLTPSGARPANTQSAGLQCTAAISVCI